MSGKSQTIRTRVYVAAPISQGASPVANCQRAIEVGFTLMDHGYAPYVPHYSYFVDVGALVGQGRYAQWISLDRSWITACHALLRLPGLSNGADLEVMWARKVSVPVFFDLDSLFARMPSTQLVDVRDGPD